MLSDVQRHLLAALRDRDPATALRKSACNDPRLSLKERYTLLGLDGDGLRLTRRVIRKLRFDRLFSDPRIVEFARRDAEAFREVFRRYDREVPPSSLQPEEEVAAFRAFQERG